MINKASGELTICTTVLHPNLSNEDFLASALSAEIARASVIADSNYYHLKLQKIDDEIFKVIVCFDPKGNLRKVSLEVTVDGIMPNWFNWSEEEEAERKKVHDAWLRQQLGPPPYEYAWGAVTSLGTGSTTSKIVIQYQP